VDTPVVVVAAAVAVVPITRATRENNQPTSTVLEHSKRFKIRVP